MREFVTHRELVETGMKVIKPYHTLAKDLFKELNNLWELIEEEKIEENDLYSRKDHSLNQDFTIRHLITLDEEFIEYQIIENYLNLANTRTEVKGRLYNIEEYKQVIKASIQLAEDTLEFLQEQIKEIKALQ